MTNNTLLLFLRMMETSRSKFEEFLTRLAGDADLSFAPQWLRIGQQQKTRESVVDGYIVQDSFKIAIETKLTPVFTVEQLHRHLDVFTGEDHRLLLLLAPMQPADTEALSSFRTEAERRRISIVTTTFERIIEVMRVTLNSTDEEMNALEGVMDL